MSEQRKPFAQVARPMPTAAPDTILRGQPSYRRPTLEFVGTVVQVVQSGPPGNRTETYQGYYWRDA